ncbi:MAG: DUF4366 domain-containing protein [Clostridium sp.]|nr:DUF4366 domain-containing protein [Lachnoclostridium sp.]MCM1253950.1 DUF4366 domain-containing protein [Clostridium sp.]
MKKKKTVNALMPLLLMAALFCTIMGGLLVSGSDSMFVHAKEAEVLAEGEAAEETEKAEETGKTDTAGETEKTDETDETVSGNTVPEPECSCKDKCFPYDYDAGCVICNADYSLCQYVEPDVKITIASPAGWHSSTTKVHISVEDIVKSGNFTVKSVQAKVSQNGSWMDITEDMWVEISENCSVYVRVSDQKGGIYEKSRYIRCFDYTAPTLNAAVSEGMLSVKAHDTDSGVKSVYVNGYEFMDVVNGTLNIRLQQFDAGYEYFTIYAMDNAGNMSEVYKTKNPYYQSEENASGSEKDPAGQLPVNAQASKPSSATAQVTEHTVTDSEGNTTAEMSLAEQKKAAMREASLAESVDEEKEQAKDTEKGKEFYTIRTDTEKVFYLIIDKDGEEEMVYFLTEIDENDLLNVTADISETLPKNSAALESAIPVLEGALPNNEESGIIPDEDTKTDMDAEAESGEMEEDTKQEEESQAATYIILGVVALIVIGGAYYFKVVRKKEDFLDEDDEEDEDEEYADDEEEESDSKDDFLEDEEDDKA